MHIDLQAIQKLLKTNYTKLSYAKAEVILCTPYVVYVLESIYVCLLPIFLESKFLSRKKAEEALERKMAFCSQLVRRAINQCFGCDGIFPHSSELLN